MPLISIIICTRNRAESLAETLVSLKSLKVPDTLLTEFIVVDNASTDNTVQVVKNFDCANISVNYVYEPLPGQVNARNTGIKSAKGQIILFTDDDVRPPQNWIEAMCTPILQGRADAVGGGVKLAPYLERAWMEPIHRLYLADTTALAADAETHPFLIGANMAFSRQIASRLKFDTQLGPGALGFGDDVLFYLQLQEMNYRLITALDIVVEHHVQESRLLRSSFLDRAKKEGRSQAYLDYHWEHKRLTRPRSQLRESVLDLIKFRLKHGWRSQSKEGINGYEMQLVKEISFLQQYLKERTRPANYEQHGLVKLRSS